MNELTKRQRQQLLRRILAERAIADQHQLASALEEEGVFCTQATISRDLNDLGVVKVRTEQGYRYQEIGEIPAQEWLERFTTLLTQFATSVVCTSNLVLLKTLPGNAHGLGATLDHLEWPEVLGTVAGDDTILVVAQGPEDAATLHARIRDLLEGPSTRP